MKIRAPLGGSTGEPGELLIHIVDWSGAVSTIAGLSPGAHIERPASVTAAIDLAARSRPDVVVLRVPIGEVARDDALRLLQSAAPACRVVMLPVRPLDESGGTDKQDMDDAAAIGLSRGLVPAARAVVRGRSLRPRAESAALARQVVRAACAAAATGDLCFDALLVGTELVTNAVRHARSAVGLTVRAWPDAVRIEVCDRVTARPALREADGTSGNGRGLTIMNALCSAWGIDPSVKGKTVWANLSWPSA